MHMLVDHCGCIEFPAQYLSATHRVQGLEAYQEAGQGCVLWMILNEPCFNLVIGCREGICGSSAGF